MRSITTSFSLPELLEKELEKEARKEHRTKSGLIQEALRYYLENKRWKKLQQDIAFRADRMGITGEESVERLMDQVRE
ncbi:MAG: ribbon-helix-helix protein, CopG family [Chlamydiae bacterium]|nr:ribbon-helix-helix protein, CopG family [Chlamydiota bacterium]MBI3277784.1 ribbon-helix-helix protein, CopG family [Chlamydiota bacterium]